MKLTKPGKRRSFAAYPRCYADPELTGGPDYGTSRDTPVKHRRIWRVLTRLLAPLPGGCSSVADYPYRKEGEPHVEAIVRTVGREWNADELIKVTDPRMLAIASESEIRAMIARCSEVLGRLRTQHMHMGSTGFETGVSGMVASYEINVEGDKGTGRIKIVLQKVGERWSVLGFWFQGQPYGSASPGMGQ